jgi:hypothetical protein
LGADRRLLAPQRDAFPEVVVPEWLPPLEREALPAYAARMAASLPVRGRVLVGGVSFGGIVAAELSRHVDAAGVVQIASCTSPHRIAAPWRWLRGVGPLLPAPLLRSRSGSTLVARYMGAREPSVCELFSDMSAAMPAAFYRWALWTLSQWQGAVELRVPIHRVHGACDRVLHAEPGATLIPGAGHLVNVTHSAEVNAWLKTV